MVAKIDPGSLSLGAIVTATVALVGVLIKRATTITTAGMTDRQVLTKDLQTEKSELNKKIEKQADDIEKVRLREMVFIRLFAIIGAEMRILISNLADLHTNLSAPKPDLGECKSDVLEMTKRTSNAVEMLDNEERLLSNQIAVVTTPPIKDAKP